MAAPASSREVALEIGGLPHVFDPSTDIADQFAAFEALANQPNHQREAVIALITQNADDLTPLFLFELARRLWDYDPDLAMEWFAVAILRTQYDARRCRDPDALNGAMRAVFHAENVISGIGRDRAAHDRATLRALMRPDLFTGTALPRWACAQDAASQHRVIMGAGPRVRSAIVAFRRSFDRPPSEWLRSETEWQAIREAIRTIALREVQQRLHPVEDPIPMAAAPYRRVNLEWAVRPDEFGWIDDRQLAVSVLSYDDPSPPPLHPYRLRIWRRDGALSDVARTHGHVCAANGTISYLVQQDRVNGDRTRHTFRVGRPGDWAEDSVTLGLELLRTSRMQQSYGGDPAAWQTVRRNPFDCSWADGTRFLVDRQSALWLPLRRGDGALVMHNAWAAHVAAEGAAPVDLPFRPNALSADAIHFYEFRDAYFVAPPYYRRSDDGAAPPPCISVWWFYPRESRADETCVATDSVNADSEAVMYAAARIGILRGAPFRRTPYGLRPAGLYVTRADGRSEKLVEAYVHALSVSPDGCAVAFAHGEESPLNFSILELCSEARP